MIKELQYPNTGSARNHIVKILKEAGIYQGTGGLTAQYKQKKVQNTMMERYGVINHGQTPGGGWKYNEITKTTISFLDEYQSYAKKVDELTKQNKKNMLPADYCFYTGIKFIDSYQDIVNPNDPLKKSIDHKISKMVGFLNNISADNISATNNLAYCLKYCNTLKNMMTEEMFTPFAKELREKFKNEGYKSN